ncbi:folylpolyglutamate synthase/dihydrofolate synthase family protein [Synechocystis sp. LKSZ1]|uniref:bifunctional folylpolyglutamate synthase/dihydrofolate synthase n=1 Tax=Synechocystis sp. LKSZ1 TaxID=3144951 RepID=UPI00336C3093
MNINDLLQPYQRFGVNLGLERIRQLLADLGNPQDQVPIIHVGGTNGKGSVCAFLSSILTQAGYRVGRYTSPHLVDWTERICLNEQPISPEALSSVLQRVTAKAPASQVNSPTLFEIMTAAAWLYFAQAKVDIAVMEVGLGGRLDATNVCDAPLASVITSLSREHWQVLGPTLADIAGEKAGILKPDCPAILGQFPPEAQAVIQAQIAQVACAAYWVQPAEIFSTPSGPWARSGDVTYPLPFAGDFQRLNSALAITTIQVLQAQGWAISLDAIQRGMAQAKWPGRLQWLTYQGQQLLLDGAHNPAAAVALGQYVRQFNRPVAWVIGMLATKDHADIFQALLQPGDQLLLVPVPGHSSADPDALAQLAWDLCPQLAKVQIFADCWQALDGLDSDPNAFLRVLCGSLYLVGTFLAGQKKSPEILGEH